MWFELTLPSLVCARSASPLASVRVLPVDRVHPSRLSTVMCSPPMLCPDAPNCVTELEYTRGPTLRHFYEDLACNVASFPSSRDRLSDVLLPPTLSVVPALVGWEHIGIFSGLLRFGSLLQEWPDSDPDGGPGLIRWSCFYVRPLQMLLPS
ncbi:unnamed protein product [Calypogeia fissa]